jgi:hypothetical protein
MNQSYTNTFTFKFQNTDNIDSLKIVQQMCSLAKDIFLLAGNQLTEQPKEYTREFNETAGWMSFP